jgi:hypothetical protein
MSLAIWSQMGVKYAVAGLCKTVVPEEVAINIGRDGELILWDGRHRLGIAQILKLSLIPVRVVVRHKAWQEKRERIYTCKDPQKNKEDQRKYLFHPDVSFLMADKVYKCQ